MSVIHGQCPDCARPLLQDYAAGGHRYLSCMGGHAWRETRGQLYVRQAEHEDPGPVQVVIPADKVIHSPPKQEITYSWLYQKPVSGA